MSGSIRLWLSIGVAIVLRLVLLFAAWSARGTEAFLAPDSMSYLVAAESLADHLSFEDFAGKPEIFRTPGYPLVLAIGFAAGHPLLFVLAAQVLMSAMIVALTFGIARRWFDDWIAGVCALLTAIEPTMLLWSVKVMAETLFTLLLLAFVASALRALESGAMSWIVAAAVALGAAVYVRPIAYPLLILICLASLLKPRKGLVFVVTCVLVVAPWHIRNYLATGFSGFSILLDRAVLTAGGSITARREHRPFTAVRDEMLNRVSFRPAGESAAMMRSEGSSLLASDPFGYARTHLAGMTRTMFEPGAVEYLRTFGLYPAAGGALQRTVDRGMVSGTTDFARRHPLAFWSSVALGLLLLPLMLMPLLGIPGVKSTTRRTYGLLAFLIIYFLIASGGVPGSSRFRAPIMPLLILMVAFVRDARKRTTG